MPIDFEKIEPAAYDDLEGGAPYDMALLYSIAVSAKRIADAVATPAGLEAALNIIANTPMNSYGEGFSEAIQNAHERGLRGIGTNS